MECPSHPNFTEAEIDVMKEVFESLVASLGIQTASDQENLARRILTTAQRHGCHDARALAARVFVH